MKQTHMSYLMSLFLRIKVFLLLSSVTDSRGPCNLCVLSCLLFLSLNLPSYSGIDLSFIPDAGELFTINKECRSVVSEWTRGWNWKVGPRGKQSSRHLCGLPAEAPGSPHRLKASLPLSGMMGKCHHEIKSFLIRSSSTSRISDQSVPI